MARPSTWAKSDHKPIKRLSQEQFTAAITSGDRLIKISEAQELTGFSWKVINTWVKDRRIPGYNPGGGHVHVLRSQILELIDSDPVGE